MPLENLDLSQNEGQDAPQSSYPTIQQIKERLADEDAGYKKHLKKIGFEFSAKKKKPADKRQLAFAF